MLLIVIGTGICAFSGSIAPCAAPLFLLQMEHSHSSESSVVFSCFWDFLSGHRSMALSLCTNPVAFLGDASGCVFVLSSMHQLPLWAQLSGSSASLVF